METWFKILQIESGPDYNYLFSLYYQDQLQDPIDNYLIFKQYFLRIHSAGGQKNNLPSLRYP